MRLATAYYNVIVGFTTVSQITYWLPAGEKEPHCIL